VNLPSPAQTTNPSASAAESTPSFKRQFGLTIGALGVVFGDIGTSPLYAMRETAQAAGGHLPGSAAIYGSVSLIFWALVIVVTIKYVVFIMRADNNGEGGVLALAALAHRAPVSRGVKTAIGVAALLGLALFYGDGMLTPAISVLSAMEGLSVDGSAFTPWVIPLTLAILVGLFILQRRGTEKIGKIFGPVMVLWFIVIAVLGVIAILKSPQILRAANPLYGLALFAREPWTAFVTLGLVVLAVTGCEALYADMGHFGRRAIRSAWLYFAFPALVLNYFGQGALLLSRPADASFLFYALVPSWAHYPMVALSAVATVIASQAVISGVFSITRQAVQLGQLPRMEIRHTSAVERGQIYVPRINVLLGIGVILIVLIFKSSDALASAYGIAVTGVMVISTVLVGVVAYHRWGWSKWAVFGVFGVLSFIDLAFLASNALKIVQGGWLPLAVAAAVFVVMDTWRVGRRVYAEKVREGSLALDLFLERADKMTQRVAGTAIFMSARSDMVPGALLHSLKHFKVMHERVVLATVTAADTPFVPASRRIAVEKLGKGFFITRLVYGFFESPDIPQDLALARAHGLALEMDQSTYFLGRETLVPARFYHLPPGRVVELGTQVTI